MNRLSPDDPGHLLRRLKDEVFQAQATYDDARKKFDFVLNQVPSGLPHPDGSLRVQMASRETSRAMALYQRALGRYTDLVLRGIMPDDGQEHKLD